jgi:hypothetical protein
MSHGYWRKGQKGWSWVEVKKEERAWPESGYPFEVAKDNVAQGLTLAREYFGDYPSGVVASGFVLIELIRHPARQKAINFPNALLKKLNLLPMEILNGMILPRSTFDQKYSVTEAHPTTRILAAIPRRQIGLSEANLAKLPSGTRAAAEMAGLEKIGPFQPTTPPPTIARSKGGEGDLELFEANLYLIPRTSQYPIKGFRALAKKLGFDKPIEQSQGRPIWLPGKPKSYLLTVKLRGPLSEVAGLAQFTLLESVKTIK